jgi:hypothetical protein
MDPREIVTGEVREPSGGPRYTVAADSGGYRLNYVAGFRFSCDLLELVQEDDLVSRPMWGDQ